MDTILELLSELNYDELKKLESTIRKKLITLTLVKQDEEIEQEKKRQREEERCSQCNQTSSMFINLNGTPNTCIECVAKWSYPAYKKEQNKKLKKKE